MASSLSWSSCFKPKQLSGDSRASQLPAAHALPQVPGLRSPIPLNRAKCCPFSSILQAEPNTKQGTLHTQLTVTHTDFSPFLFPFLTPLSQKHRPRHCQPQRGFAGQRGSGRLLVLQLAVLPVLTYSPVQSFASS